MDRHDITLAEASTQSQNMLESSNPSHEFLNTQPTSSSIDSTPLPNSISYPVPNQSSETSTTTNGIVTGTKRHVFGTQTRTRVTRDDDSRSRRGRDSGWRRRQDAGIPDPLILRKMAIVVVFALCVWAFYVVVGRVCTPLIRGQDSSGMGPGVGGILVGFVIVWLLFMWSYIKMITTGPGFAKDVIPKSQPPPDVYNPFQIPQDASHLQTPTAFRLENSPNQNSPSSLPNSSSNSALRPSNHMLASNNTYPPTAETQDEAGPDPSEFAPASNLLTELSRSISMQQSQSSSTTVRQPITAGVDGNGGTKKVSGDDFEERTNVNEGTGPDPGEYMGKNQISAKGREGDDKQGKKSQVKDWMLVDRPVPTVPLGPRWCRFCEIYKPDRTHHCRHCGTCVLAFDHHCLWIGQCVGHRNHKIFINFNLWTMVFTVYMMVFLILFETRSAVYIDGQVIALIAVSAIFTLFTVLMLPSHIHLILTGQTTVESFAARDQSAQESALLTREYGVLWNNQLKRKVKKRWREEWGGSGVDQRWAWGSWSDRWVEEMGDSWIGWILPIGKPKGDGIHFKSNPRFGPNGEWLRKKDWPAGVV